MLRDTETLQLGSLVALFIRCDCLKVLGSVDRYEARRCWRMTQGGSARHLRPHSTATHDCIRAAVLLTPARRCNQSMGRVPTFP